MNNNNKCVVCEKDQTEMGENTTREKLVSLSKWDRAELARIQKIGKPSNEK